MGAVEQVNREAGERAMAEVNQGIARWGEGNLVAAAAYFERALAERPGWPPALSYLAAARLEAGQLDDAVTIAEELLAADPGNSQALMVLGRARLASDPAEGLRLLESAVGMYPYRVVCLLTLAEAYLQSGQPDPVPALLDRAVEIEPGNPWVADLRQRLGKPS